MTTETIKPLDLSRTYTAAEFETLEDGEDHYELVEGKLVEMPPTGDRHGRISKRLVKHLLAFDPDEKLGQVWFTTGVKLDEKNVLEPDLTFIIANRIPSESNAALNIIPDLIVEIWSPSDVSSLKKLTAARDKIRKFLEAGVQIGWFINPHNQTVEVYHLGQTEAVALLGLEDELDGENVIPGFRLKVKALFG
ncbi:MAG: Uma2 family endonuclease [Chloroflexi bacterium]|nr:Uma2 family endonuclease [Chloroflexota bacterium]